MSFLKKSFVSTMTVDRAALEELFQTATLLKPVASGQYRTEILGGLVACTLFLEPSTRTRLSFEAAVCRLGGKCLTITGTEFSALSKGESYADMARVISGYSDLVVLRTNSAEISKQFFDNTTKPVINAGSGSDEHPTQALLDVFTAVEQLEDKGKTLEGSHIALVGDLKYGRTVHSLVKLLRLYKGITYHIHAPPYLTLPNEILEIIKSAGHQAYTYNESEISMAVSKADIIYTTRLQKERLENPDTAQSFSEHYKVDAEVLDKSAKKDVIVMHPLPRDSREGSNDLPISADDQRLAIFHQTDNGVPIRMALICKIFGVSDGDIADSLKPSFLHKM